MRVLWFTGVVIAIDQATKMLVMKTMYLGQQIHLIGDWLKFTYTENPGMAFGITFGPRGMVTVFSVIATFLITLYLFRVRKGYFPYRASLAFILGGAVGNIIDRVFYGAIFGGDSLFVGRVVDFIHVNVWSGFIPESLPMIGGTYLSLFPIWNVADMAIVCGVVGILYFQKKYHLIEYYGSEDGPGESISDIDSKTDDVGGSARTAAPQLEVSDDGEALSSLRTEFGSNDDVRGVAGDESSTWTPGAELEKSDSDIRTGPTIQRDSDAAA